MTNSTNQTLLYPPTMGQILGWWASMVFFSLLNCLFLIVVWFKTRKNVRVKPKYHVWSYYYSWFMRLAAIPYVWECTWRSFLPSLYNSRLTIVDDLANSIFIARMFAMLGEICWAWQMALAMGVISNHVPYRGPPWVEKLGTKAIPIAAGIVGTLGTVAQAFSVTGMITLNYIFVVVEESMWAVIFILYAVCNIYLWWFAVDDFHVNVPIRIPGLTRCFMFRFSPERNEFRGRKFHHDDMSVWVMRIFIRGMAIFGIAATPYMVSTDVPKWYARWQADEAANKQYLIGDAGLHDAIYRRNPSQMYEDWRADQFWLSAYFSVASAWSVMLMFAPGRVATENCNCEQLHNGSSQRNLAVNMTGMVASGPAGAASTMSSSGPGGGPLTSAA